MSRGRFDIDVVCRVRGMLDRLCGLVSGFGVKLSSSQDDVLRDRGARKALGRLLRELPKSKKIFHSILRQPYPS
jgi:hypothetical protein